MVDGGMEIKGRKKDGENIWRFQELCLPLRAKPIKATQMRTNILLTVVLMAGMMLAGCAKEESSEEPRKGNDMEQTLTKEQIVGVWRSGEYWVSFSEDGYMSAYLSDKCIAEGEYIIDGDTVKVDDGYYMIRRYGEDTRIVINNIIESTLLLTVTYNDLTILYRGDEGLNHHLTKSYTFSKTQETPCSKNNMLVDKTCTFPMDVWYIKGVGPDAVMESTPGMCTITVESHNIINVKMLPIVNEGYNAGNSFEYMYVYLPPKLYMIDISTHGGGFETDRPMKIYEPSFGSDGSMAIPYIYPENLDEWLKKYPKS